MHYEWFISLRYLKAKRRHGFISLISLISVAGVAVGVMALIVVLAVMTGFTEGLRDKILGINSHIVLQRVGSMIENYQDLRQKTLTVSGIRAVTPYIYAQIMVTGGNGGTGAILRGVDPDSVQGVVSLGEQIISGSIKALDSAADQGQQLPGILVGKELARQLGVGLHDKLRLLSPAGPLTPVGIIPRIRTCRIVGIFESGMYEYDSSLAYVSLATAQQFLDIDNAVHGLEIKVDDIYQAGEIAATLEKTLGFGYVAKDWITMNKNLFSALKLEKTAV